MSSRNKSIDMTALQRKLVSALGAEMLARKKCELADFSLVEATDRLAKARAALENGSRRLALMNFA